MSIQQNFPAISPSLNLNFARSKTLDPRITFSRTSTATRVNEQGLVEVVSADIPRFDHEYENGVIKSLGLLVEEERSNLLTYSADFNNWSKIRSYISGVNVISPDGTESANKIVEDNSLGTHYVRKLPTVSADAVCAISVYVKSAQRSQFAINTYGSNGWNDSLTAIYDLPTGNITGTNAENCTINAVGNGWYRATYIATKNSTSGTANVDFYTALNGNVSYQGDNSSGIYLWGAQLEEGAFPTSYIPTTSGGTATRNPDTVTMTGDNFSDWYNQEQGSFLWIGNVYSREISPVNPFRVNQGANLRGLGIQFDTRSANNSATFASRTQSSNIPAKIAPSGIIPSDNKIKIAGGYIESVGLSTIRAAFNGLPEDSYSGSSQTDITYDTMYEIEIMGNRGISGTNNQFTGVCEQLVYYPRIFTDDQLQNLTK